MIKTYSKLLLIAFITVSGNIIANPFESITLKAEFNPGANKVIFEGKNGRNGGNGLNLGLEPAKAECDRLQGLGQDVYFTLPDYKIANKYHITLSTVESTTPGQQLTTTDVNKVKALAYKHFEIKNGYEGRFFALHAFVKGTDAAGNDIDVHCKDPAELNQYIAQNPGVNITQVHFALRFGTSPARGAPGLLPTAATAYLDDIKANNHQHGFYDLYENKAFTGHLTVGTLKCYQGKTKPAGTNPLGHNLVKDLYNQIHTAFENWSRTYDTKNTGTFKLKHFHLSGETNVNGKRRFDVIEELK